MKKYLLILLVISLSISACTAQSTEEPAASLIGAWKLTSYGPVDSQSPALADVEAGITFSADGTLTGNSGCNGFGGSYTVEGAQITFSEIVSTLMLCDPLIMEQEEAVYQVINNTASFKIEGNTLTITNDDRMLVFTTTVSYPSYP